MGGFNMNMYKKMLKIIKHQHDIDLLSWFITHMVDNYENVINYFYDKKLKQLYIIYVDKIEKIDFNYLSNDIFTITNCYEFL